MTPICSPCSIFLCCVLGVSSRRMQRLPMVFLCMNWEGQDGKTGVSSHQIQLGLLVQMSISKMAWKPVEFGSTDGEFFTQRELRNHSTIPASQKLHQHTLTKFSAPQQTLLLQNGKFGQCVLVGKVAWNDATTTDIVVESLHATFCWLVLSNVEWGCLAQKMERLQDTDSKMCRITTL